MLAEPAHTFVPTHVDLSPGVERALAAAAIAAWPREAVLLLVGQFGPHQARVEQCIELSNTAPGNEAFAVDPVQFARLETELRAAGRAWIGFAHSHPNGDAVPSPVDRTSLWPHCVQLVLGLSITRECSLGAYWRNGGTMLRLALRAASTTSPEVHP